jgi:hypothetical protein
MGAAGVVTRTGGTRRLCAPEIGHRILLRLSFVLSWTKRTKQASDYVRTHTDLATMEGANEAARRATNAILAVSGVAAPPCDLWKFDIPIAMPRRTTVGRGALPDGPAEPAPRAWVTGNRL